MAIEQKAFQWSRDEAAFWAIFVVALGWRLVLLGQHSFHMDEACIAGWSKRIVHGDLLLTGGMRNDKPPLQMYLGAIGLFLFGESESAIRLMNASLSALECGLLAWALVPVAGLAAALGAGLLLAASPLHRSYGATGIMDGPLSFFLLLSFVLAVRGRSSWSGLAWGLAFCAKQTALFLVPWPLLALLVTGLAWRTALVEWGLGAAMVCGPLMLWEVLFAHPRLGAFVGMAANQPEVGLRLGGMTERVQHWMQISSADLVWAPALTLLALAGPVVGLVLLWKAREGQARAWAWSLGFPLYGMAVFAALNMRFFDRYAVPYAWALCATPAVLASAWAAGSRGRRVFGVLSLVLGLAGMFLARTQALPTNQQGVAGSDYDGYRALLLDVKQREPLGGVIVSSQGGLRHMGAWYLNPAWRLAETPEVPEVAGRPFYAAEREGSAPPAAWKWKLLQRYDAFGPAPAWILYKAEP